MQMVEKASGDVVITEGDDGDNLYVVETGLLRCTKVLVSTTLFLFNSQS